MENPTLPTNWLAALSNANHDGTTQQIDDAVGNFETENQVFLQKAQAVHQARVQEDDVWQKSQVDPVVKQLEAADKQPRQRRLRCRGRQDSADGPEPADEGGVPDPDWRLAVVRQGRAGRTAGALSAGRACQDQGRVRQG